MEYPVRRACRDHNDSEYDDKCYGENSLHLWESLASGKIVGKMAKRMFIAVDLSKEARAAAAGMISAAEQDFPDAKVKWEFPAKLHLTLRFLGPVDDRKVAYVLNAVRTAATFTKLFNITLAGAGVFPNTRRPRVIWLGVREGREELTGLANGLEEALPAEYLQGEHREFSPHCTIGRIKAPESCRKLVHALEDRPFEPVSWTVNEIVLYESVLLPTGSVYSAIERVTLFLG